MFYGVHVQDSGEYGNPLLLAEMARDAEDAGWDGFFIWDHIAHPPGTPTAVTDPTVTLAAIASSTTRIHFGPMVTPLARRRPWKLARELVALDALSNGRLVLGVGLGDPAETEFAAFGETSDAKTRASKLDESLEILTGVWTGQPFSFDGQHYRLDAVTFLPTPVQSPRIPIWVAGEWPTRRPFRRAARWDGIFPSKRGVAVDEMMSPHDLKDIIDFIMDERASDEPFTVALGGYTPASDRQQAIHIVGEYVDVGLNYWLEGLNALRLTLPEARERIWQGPPKP